MKKQKSSLIRRFLPYYGKYIPMLIFDLVCAALTTVCEIVLPMIVRYITDTGINDLPSLTVGIILRIGLLYVLLRLIDTAANYYMASVGHIMGAKIETSMRYDLFSHLQKLSFAYYDNTKIGTLMSRITSDLFDVTEFAHHCPEEFFIAAIKIVCSFVLLCTMSVPLTLIIFSVIPVMYIVMTYFSRRMYSGFRESRVTLGELNSQIEDSLLGIRTVKAFCNENAENEKFERGNGEFLNVKSRIYRLMASFQASTRLFDGIMYIAVVTAGSVFMIKGQISPADLVAYLMFVTMLLNSVRRIVEFTEQFQRGLTGIERFCEIMNVEPDIDDLPGASDIGKVRGDIEFKGVNFGYGGDNKNILTDLNLRVRAGESIALVGPSGGGKTTLCSLIPRFYEAISGEILLDGVNIRNITLRSLRSQIGVVQQDVYLFSGSVRDNIAYGRPGATDDEIKEAARLAGADEFISKLPNGYDTYVGERGVKLSGGQKQRVSIARVFLKNPPVLILDEATSALDNESERIVQSSLERLAAGRTTFTIAHRLTTVKNAESILVLTENGIEEQGSHEELMARGGLYAELYGLYTEQK